MRFRHKYMIFGSILVALIWTLSDPDLGLIENLGFGSGLIATIVILVKSILYAALFHITRKGLFDYLDFEEIVNKAKQTSDGASRVAIAMSIFGLAISVLILAAVSN